MTTLYIACNHTIERGYFLGDAIVCRKMADVFRDNVRADNTIISLMDSGPLQWVWDGFQCDDIVRDSWGDRGSQPMQYKVFDERIRAGEVNGVPFTSYRELYPRLDGGLRQGVLCGEEAGLGRKNIFEYFYYGQNEVEDNPIGLDRFDPLFDIECEKYQGRVLIAPLEKCQGNVVFTHEMWKDVIKKLLESGIAVTVNTGPDFMCGFSHPLLRVEYPPLDRVHKEVAKYPLVVCGNTGIGWVAGAVGVPLLACERDMAFSEYGFKRCGVSSLIDIIDEPDVTLITKSIVENLV